jgi:hypothetical protein
MIAEVQQRLRGTGSPFRAVAGATALAQVKDRPIAMPAAFVIPLQEASEPNSRIDGPVFQRTAADVGVIIVCENVADAKGGATNDLLSDLKAWVRRQLIGFAPTAEADPMEHVTGGIIKAAQGTVWFQDVFGTAYYQEEAPNP